MDFELQDILINIVKEKGIVNKIIDMKYEMELSEKKKLLHKNILKIDKEDNGIYYNEIDFDLYNNNITVDLIIDNINKEHRIEIFKYKGKMHINKKKMVPCKICHDYDTVFHMYFCYGCGDHICRPCAEDYNCIFCHDTVCGDCDCANCFGQL